MKTYKLLLFISCTVIATSCKKYLEVNPDNRAEINSIEKVADLVGTAYPYYGYLAMAEMYSDNVGDKGFYAGGTHVNTPYPQLYKWEDIVETGNNTPTQYWNGVYTGIAAANQALESIEKYKLGAAANAYKGEALLARAYGHFMLVTFFAKAYVPGAANDAPGIPYVLAPETVPIVQYDRGTVASVYEQIEKDIVEGLPLLAGGQWQVPKYHFTPSAANAFAARFYLFKGDWRKVIDHANRVFPNGDYTGNLRDLVTEAAAITDQALYRAFWNKADKRFNLLIHEVYSTHQRNSQFGTSRYGFTRPIYTANSLGTTPAGAAFVARAWTSGGTDNLLLQKFNEFFYYTNVTAGTGYPYIMQPLLTADEAIMNRAEAYAQLNLLDSAVRDCNLFAKTRIANYNVNTHAVAPYKSQTFFGVTDPKQAMILTVLDFKRRAFLTEGIRWMDILRHRLTVKHNLFDDANNETFIELGPDDNRRMFQIPQEAILRSGVTPNPR